MEAKNYKTYYVKAIHGTEQTVVEQIALLAVVQPEILNPNIRAALYEV